MTTRWIWSETVPPRSLLEPRPLAVLRRYGLQPLVAIRPDDLGVVPELCAALGERRQPFGLWPMLDDAAGRWASASNLDAFLTFCDAVLDRASAAPPSVLAFDFEPSIELVRPLTHGGLPRLPRLPQSLEPARGRLRSFLASLRTHGIGSLAAAVPLVLHDAPGSSGLQRALGTPIIGVGFEHVSVMTYTSLLEGWSRGSLRRVDARALLATWAERAARRGFGLSLGAVGLGAFGNEPRYRSPEELREDVILVRALGVDRLALLDLGGVLAREPAEEWLDAFATEAPSLTASPSTLRVHGIVAALDAVASALA